jgi:hypothetical protein
MSSHKYVYSLFARRPILDVYHGAAPLVRSTPDGGRRYAGGYAQPLGGQLLTLLLAKGDWTPRRSTLCTMADARDGKEEGPWPLFALFDTDMVTGDW